MFEVTPEWAFIVSKFVVNLVCAWPPSKNASRKELIIFEIKWWILWINSLLLNIPLLYTAYCDRKDMLIVAKSVCFSASCFQISIKMLICKIFRNQMQFVLDELERHVRNAELHERDIFLSYTKRCGFIHVTYLFYASIAIVGLILGPLVLPQSLPSDAKYPFPIDGHPVYELVYMQQSIVGTQMFFMLGIDCQMAMMIWCIVVRLEILAMEIRNITNTIEFSVCIQSHQYLLRLANEVAGIVRYVLLTTVIVATLSSILGGVYIVGNHPLLIRIQFAVIVSGFCLLILLNAWPSEIMMRSCEDIGTALYESAWASGTSDRSIVIAMQRSENPVVITVAGLLPILSLNYYTTYLSRTFSFFTTLRVVLAKIEEN